MNCPVDNSPLTMTERQGVEIDYCPKCRGVWLDRGELDKIVERAAALESGAPRPAAAPYPPRETERYDDDHDEHYRDDRYHPRRKRRGLLGELFDFD